MRIALGRIVEGVRIRNGTFAGIWIAAGIVGALVATADVAYRTRDLGQSRMAALTNDDREHSEWHENEVAGLDTLAALLTVATTMETVLEGRWSVEGDEKGTIVRRGDVSALLRSPTRDGGARKGFEGLRVTTDGETVGVEVDYARTWMCRKVVGATLRVPTVARVFGVEAIDGGSGGKRHDLRSYTSVDEVCPVEDEERGGRIRFVPISDARTAG